MIKHKKLYGKIFIKTSESHPKKLMNFLKKFFTKYIIEIRDTNKRFYDQ